jgi:hypothetical protein
MASQPLNVNDLTDTTPPYGTDMFHRLVFKSCTINKNIYTHDRPEVNERQLKRKVVLYEKLVMRHLLADTQKLQKCIIATH